MASKFISLALASIALTASATSFAGPSTAEYNYPADTTFTSQKTRAEVQAEARGARAFLALPEALYGSAALSPATMSKLTRDQVRTDAVEYARGHKDAFEVRG